MSGHSKWSKIKRLKGALDAKRGKLFSNLSKEITVATKLGGGNPDFNPRLRAAVQSAKDQSMPSENIERAIKKGSGELGAQAIEEIIYEGYGPGGIAIMIEAATDNKNRTAADLRSIFHKNQGNLAASGSVSYLFHRKGQIRIAADASLEDRVLEVLLEAGADELDREEGVFVATTPPDRLYVVTEALRQAGFQIEDQNLTFIPTTSTLVEAESVASQLLRLCEALEDCDDVLRTHSNFDLPGELLESLSR